jgi:hypothetical protein
MKKTKMITTLVLVLFLMVWPASVASGAQYLTVNGVKVNSITLELGQSCTVEVISTDRAPYTDYVGFDYGQALGMFSHLETKPEAGMGAMAIAYQIPPVYGYRITVFSPVVAPTVHFVFQYDAQEVGETNLELYNNTYQTIDSVHIKVIPVPMGTAITYQGRLIDADDFADGLYDFQFKLFDANESGTQKGPAIYINDFDVVEGQFTIELDFGSDVYNGDARWLETTVSQSDGSDPCTLRPRVELTPAPYAIYAQTAGGDGDWRVSGNNMYSIPSGNVGVGTTGPTQKLDVAGNITASRYYDRNNTDYYMEPANTGRSATFAGKVGIGTTNPLYELDVIDGSIHVEGTNQYNLIVVNNGISTGAPYWAGSFISNVENASHSIAVSGTSQGASDKNIGGRFSASGGTENFAIWSNNGTNYFADNVGIGTTNPRSKLSVGGEGRSDSSVYGSGSSNGVYGSGSSNGVYGSGSSTGVKGYSGSATGRGVEGLASNSGSSTNYGGYFKAEGDTGRGVYGWSIGSNGYGVMGTGYVGIRGESAYSGGAGVSGESIADSGYGVKAVNSNSSGTGLYATGGTNGYAAEFDGDVLIRTGGRLITPVLDITGADLAEEFPFSEPAEPGMVVSIDHNNAGKLSLARGAYNRRVAGIVAGANDFSTGLVLGKDGKNDTLKLPVALSGRVYCRADASNGPIEPGDLLTTSDIAGHAMKVTDYTRAQGAILGKAMTSLEKGKGLVLVLVSLQ